MKKTRFFLFISLFVVSAILLSSCSSKLSVAKSFDAVLNKDYSPELEITEEISEISELKDMNFLDSKGEFMTFSLPLPQGGTWDSFEKARDDE